MLQLQVRVDLGVMTMKGYSKTGALPSDGIMPYPGYSLWMGCLNPLPEMQYVYSTASISWAVIQKLISKQKTDSGIFKTKEYEF